MADAVKDTRDFFSTAERILFDIITWVILIPKTLYLVLANPRGVPEYVKRELSADRSDRFEDGISPVFLYLIVALGPFLLIQLFTLPKVPISGPSQATMGEPATFSVHFDSLESLLDEDIAFEWSVLDENRLALGPPVRDCFPYSCDEAGVTSLAMEEDPEYQLFEGLVRDSSRTAQEARSAVAAVYGDEEAQSIYDFWCSPPPYAGCEGSNEEAFGLLGQLVEVDGLGVDAARATLESESGGVAAAEAVAFWCAPPPDAGCADSDAGKAWKLFERTLAEQPDVQVAEARVADAYDGPLAAAIVAYWCSPPAGVGCGAEDPGYVVVTVDPEEQGELDEEDVAGAGGASEEAYERFFELIDEGFPASDARVVVADEFGDAAGTEIHDFWCSPPPGAGCGAEDAAAQEDADDEAFQMFAELVESDLYPALIARDEVSAIYGAETADGIFEYWCSPPAFAGCPGEPAECEVGGDSDEAAASLICTWPEEGTYFVSVQIRDFWSDELLDTSDPRQVLVVASSDAADSGEARGKGKAKSGSDASAGGGARRGSRDLSALIKDTRTLLLALAFLAFPLYWSLIVVMFRGPSLSQASIKPAFYVQCLYLSPIVFAFWIPFLLGVYLPELEGSMRLLSLWALLIVVLIGWLLYAEVGFVAEERSMSKRRAFVLLAAFSLPPLLIVYAALEREMLASSFQISKFDMVESLGFLLIVLMFVPFVAKLASFSRWRKSSSG